MGTAFNSLKELSGRTAVMVIASIAGMAVPFIVFPLVARFASPMQWAQFASGQAFGAIGGAILAFSWPVSGIQHAAGRSGPRGALSESLATRMWLAPPTIALSIFLCIAFPSTRNTLAVTTAVTYCVVAGFNNAWYFVATSQPLKMMAFTTLPAIVASAISVPVIVVSHSAIAFPVSLLFCTLLAIASLHLSNTERHHPFNLKARRKQAFKFIRTEWKLNAGEVVAALSLGGPIIVGNAILSSTDVALYATADKLFRAAIGIVVMIASVVQGWLLGKMTTKSGNRFRSTLVLFLILGTIMGAAFSASVVPASRILFGAVLTTPPLLGAILGLALATTTVSTLIIRSWLLPNGSFTLVLVGKVLGACVSVTLAAVGATALGVIGLGLGILLGELLQLSLFIASKLRAGGRDIQSEELIS